MSNLTNIGEFGEGFHRSLVGPLLEVGHQVPDHIRSVLREYVQFRERLVQHLTLRVRLHDHVRVPVVPGFCGFDVVLEI